MKENDWIDGMRTRLRDAEQTPPVDGWARLESQLAKPRGALLGWPWVVGAAVAAMVVVACGVTWWWIPADVMSDEPLLVAEQHERPNDVLLPLVEEPVALTAHDAPIQRTTPQAASEQVAPTASFAICEERSEADEEPLSAQDGGAAAEEVADAADEPAARPTNATTTVSTLTHGGLPAAAKAQRTTEPLRKRGWQLGVMGSGGRAISTAVVMRDQFNQSFDSDPGSNMFGDANSDSVRTLLVPKQQIVTSKRVIHHQPWSFGLTLSHDLGHGFSFETGLVYTLLRSDTHYATYSTVQRVYLLGVPLRVDKEVFGAGRFSLYAGVGGMVEMPVYCSFEGRHMKERAVQCSLTATLGAEYRIGRLTALYAEPGVAWYMTDMHLETIRTEDPLSLSLRLGVRFRLGMKE